VLISSWIFCLRFPSRTVIKALSLFKAILSDGSNQLTIWGVLDGWLDEKGIE